MRFFAIALGVLFFNVAVNFSVCDEEGCENFASSFVCEECDDPDHAFIA